MRVAIVTDDLTSATDGTVAFAEGGWSVHVARGQFHAERLPAADVVSVDVQSRVADRREAIARVDAAAMKLAQAPIIVKQFDSTLRGHVVAEIMAMQRASCRRRVVV